MTTDHNEAMRLANAIDPGWLENVDPDKADINMIQTELRTQAARIAELESRVHTCGPTCSKAGCINRRLTAERDTLRAELETERMRLSACGVVAMANTAESAAKARDMHPDYLCASVRDVAAAVDREMALRAEVERLKPNAERYEWLCEKLGETQLPTLIERITQGYVADYKPSIDAAIDTARKATP